VHDLSHRSSPQTFVEGDVPPSFTMVTPGRAHPDLS